MSNKVDPFEIQRKMFRESIIEIVNMLNRIFNYNFVQSKNGEMIQSKLITVDKNNLEYTYQPLSELFRLSVNQMDSQVKNTLFRKICKNLVVLFAKPLPPKLSKKKASLPLVDIKSENTQSRIIITKNGKEIFEGPKTQICSEHEIQDFKNYLYLKLKLLIYLNDVLNLDESDDKNKYERHFLDYIERTRITRLSNQNQTQEISYVKTKFEKWMKQVEMIIKQVMSDTYNTEILKKMVSVFEEGDPTTVELCESLVPLCQNASSLNAKDICSPDRITMHSVTEDVCNPETLYEKEIEYRAPSVSRSVDIDVLIGREIKRMKILDDKISKETGNIPVNLNDFNKDVQKSFEQVIQKKKRLDDNQKQINLKISSEDIKEKKKTLNDIIKLNNDSEQLLEDISENPVLKIQRELDSIDIDNITDPKQIKSTSIALENLGSLLDDKKEKELTKELSFARQKSDSDPYASRESLKETFESQIKPIFGKEIKQNEIRDYKDILTRKISSTPRTLEKTKYGDWFKKIAEKTKLPQPVQQQIKRQADLRAQDFSRQFLYSETPEKRRQLENQFREEENRFLEFLGKQLEDRKRLIERLNPDQRMQFLQEFANTTTLEQQDQLIQRYNRIASMPEPIQPVSVPPVVSPIVPPVVSPIVPPVVKPIVPPVPPVVTPIVPPAVKPIVPPAVKPIVPPVVKPIVPPVVSPPSSQEPKKKMAFKISEPPVVSPITPESPKAIEKELFGYETPQKPPETPQKPPEPPTPPPYEKLSGEVLFEPSLQERLDNLFKNNKINKQEYFDLYGKIIQKENIKEDIKNLESRNPLICLNDLDKINKLEGELKTILVSIKDSVDKIAQDL